MSERVPSGSTPIRSTYADDPDMRGLVDLFAAELPQRTEALTRAWEGQQLDTVRRLAHQLRGASAGYGFAMIGQAAGRLEDAVYNRTGGPTASVEEVTRHVNELIDLCRRVRA